MAELINESTNQLTDREIVQGMVTLSAEYVTVIEKIETAKSDQKRDVLRDLSNTGLALLAGSLTLLTVGTQFIKTPNALYIGMVIVMLTVIFAFAIRIKIGRRFTRIIDRQYSEYASRSNAARALITANDHNKAQYEMDRIIQETPFISDSFSKLLDTSEVTIGLMLLVGGFITSVGIVFDIVIK